MAGNWDHGGKSRHARGYGSAWDKLRKTILDRDKHLCQPCKLRGRITPGNQVDHILSKAKGGTDAPSNLQAICKSCHVAKTANDNGHRSPIIFGRDGWPVRSK